jgi:hypothetical protein
MIDRPRLFRDPAEVKRREAEIFSTNVAPLNTWVRELRDRLGPNAIVPWFDPQDGGCEAQILWLLEAPGPKATRERGGRGFAPQIGRLHIIECPHPSPTNLNTRPGNRERVIEAWQDALKYVEG